MEDDRALAQTGLSFPLIIGGHEHVPFLEKVGRTFIVKAGADAEQAAVIDLVWPADGARRSSWLRPESVEILLHRDDVQKHGRRHEKRRQPDDGPRRDRRERFAGPVEVKRTWR